MFAPFVKNIARHRIKFVRETIKAIEKTRGSKCWIRRIGENVEIALGNVFGSSDRRLKVGNFRPISRATPSSLRLFTTPGNLIGDGTRYTSVSRILIIQGGIIFSLSFSLSNCREFERNSKHFLSSTRHVLGMANEVEFENFENYENYALCEFSRIIDRIEKLVFIFVKEGWEDWIKKKSMLWYLVIVA